MSVQNILQQLDNEIANLTQARAILAGSSASVVVLRKKGKRIISAAARRRMAAAQKARWAKFRAKKKSR
jgi:hypothetical protein